MFRCKGVNGGKVQVVALPPRRIDRTGNKLYKDRVSFNIIILGRKIPSCIASKYLLTRKDNNKKNYF